MLCELFVISEKRPNRTCLVHRLKELLAKSNRLKTALSHFIHDSMNRPCGEQLAWCVFRESSCIYGCCGEINGLADWYKRAVMNSNGSGVTGGVVRLLEGSWWKLIGTRLKMKRCSYTPTTSHYTDNISETGGGGGGKKKTFFFLAYYAAETKTTILLLFIKILLGKKKRKP